MGNTQQRAAAGRRGLGRWLLPFANFCPSEQARRRKKDGIVVRVIEYELENVEDAEPVDPPDHDTSRARRRLPHRNSRPSIPSAGKSRACRQFKTHLRGGQIVLRSKTRNSSNRSFTA